MHHVFITPLALDFSEKGVFSCALSEEKLLKVAETFAESILNKPSKKCKTYESYEDRIYNIIDFWINHSSKFYTEQKSEDTFEVVLLYSKRFKPILDTFHFPEWARLEEHAIERSDLMSSRLSSWNTSIWPYLSEDFIKKYEGLPVSISRTDADDYFSNDIFNIISEHQKAHDDPFFLILYTTFRQYWRWNGKYTEEVSSNKIYRKGWSSGNATLVFSSFSKSITSNENSSVANLSLMSFHAHLGDRFKVYYEEHRCSFIQSLGSNLGNSKWTRKVDENFKLETMSQSQHQFATLSVR